MKRMLKKAFKRLGSPLLEQLGSALETSNQTNEAVSQKVLMQQYRLMAAQHPELLPDFRDAGFRKYSQFEEDGLLLYIFSLLKPLNRVCVEICAGDGRECNTANLIINHGWWGHLFDGDERKVKIGRTFYARNKDTFVHPPRFTQAWITAENVNDEISKSGASGPIDLLSLDMDGVDYWVWKAIKVIEPQVVICETHNSIPPDKALTVPYEAEFAFESRNFRGASLLAMAKLGKEKGYRLVGTHRFGFNAIFIKQGLVEKYFPEVDVASCVQDPYSAHARRDKWPKVKDAKWKEV